MTDYNDLIERLLDPRNWGGRLDEEAAVAIKQLVAERDAAEEAVSAATDLKQKWRERAETAEAEAAVWREQSGQWQQQFDALVSRTAGKNVLRLEDDLATARKALRDYSKGDLVYYAEHAAAIRMARAEQGDE